LSVLAENHLFLPDMFHSLLWEFKKKIWSRL